jgi:hypothetical protein
MVIFGGCHLRLNNNFKIEPSLFFQKHGEGITTLDINSKVYYRNKNWLLLSYQSFSGFLAGFGINIISGIQLYYTYGINTTGLSGHQKGSQSISIQADVTSMFGKIRNNE